MNINTHTTFAQLLTAKRQSLENAVETAVAHTEAARDFLNQAERQGHDPDFWREALNWAEEQEAQARRALANWQHGDRRADQRAFVFRRALAEKARALMNAQRKDEERSFASLCANVAHKEGREPKPEAQPLSARRPVGRQKKQVEAIR